MTTAKKETSDLTLRIVTSEQSKGSLGKSTVLSFLTEWYLYAGVPFIAVDCDPVHRSLANRYPGRASAFDATASRDEFGALLSPLPSTPAVIWDFPAQFTPEFLEHSDHFGLIETLTHAKARMTMLVFASDDQDATDSAASLFGHFGGQIDWVLVTNPSNFKSVEFKKTGLYERFAERQTPVIDVPHLSTVSKNAWAEAENQEQRPLSIGEAIKHPGLPFVARRELSGVLDRMFVQFEDNAALLVPSLDLIKNRTVRVKAPASHAPVSRFQNPLLAKK